MHATIRTSSTGRDRGSRQEDRSRRSAPTLPSRSRHGRRRHRGRRRRPLPPPSPARPRPTYTTPGGRVGIGTAFRTAFHPVNIREDVAALPWLLRSRAFLIPLGITVASAVLVTRLGRPTTSSPPSCSPTSSRPRRSAARSSRGSSRRGRAGSSGSSSRLVAGVGYGDLHPQRDDGHAGPGRSPGRPIPAAFVAVADPRRALRGRRRVVPPVPAAVEPEPRAPAPRPSARPTAARGAAARRRPRSSARSSRSAQATHPGVAGLADAVGALRATGRRSGLGECLDRVRDHVHDRAVALQVAVDRAGARGAGRRTAAAPRCPARA